MISKEERKKILNWFSNAKNIVIAGVGNPLRRDDSVGVEVIKKLHNKVSTKVFLIQCETVPESFMQPIIDFNPSHIMVIDAGLLGLPPGSIKMIESKELSVTPAISTHSLPLKIFCKYLQQTTSSKIALLIIQPKETGFGEGLTDELLKTSDYVTNFLLKILP